MTDHLEDETETKVVELPHRLQVDPFVGYKEVRIGMVDGRVNVSGSWREVKIDDTAKCHHYPAPDEPHTAPHQGCSCGFHALKDRDDVWSSAQVVATVELFGLVINAEKGFRASRQRILSMDIRQACEMCRSFSDQRRLADAVYFAIDGTPFPLCTDHGELSQRLNATMRLTPNEIADRVGTEVTWRKA